METFPHCNSVSLYFPLVWRQHDGVRRQKACEFSSLDSRLSSPTFPSSANPLASVFSLVWAGWLGSSFPALKFSGGERHNLLALTFRKSFYMPEFRRIIIKWLCSSLVLVGRVLILILSSNVQTLFEYCSVHAENFPTSVSQPSEFPWNSSPKRLHFPITEPFDGFNAIHYLVEEALLNNPQA